MSVEYTTASKLDGYWVSPGGVVVLPVFLVIFFLVLEMEESAAVDAGERGGTGQPAGEMTVDSCLVFGWEGEQRGQHELGRSNVQKLNSRLRAKLLSSSGQIIE